MLVHTNSTGYDSKDTQTLAILEFLTGGQPVRVSESVVATLTKGRGKTHTRFFFDQ
jgi:hypothetical protein